MMETFTIDDINRARNFGLLIDQIDSASQLVKDIKEQIDQLKLSDDEKVQLIDLRDKLRSVGLT